MLWQILIILDEMWQVMFLLRVCIMNEREKMQKNFSFLISVFKRTITDLLNQKITDDNYLDIFLCLFKEARILSKSDASPKSYANVSNT